VSMSDAFTPDAIWMGMDPSGGIVYVTYSSFSTSANVLSAFSVNRGTGGLTKLGEFSLSKDTMSAQITGARQ